MEKQKTFSVAEANKMLPLVKAIVRDIRDHYRSYARLREALARLERSYVLDPAPRERDRINSLEGDLRRNSSELRSFMRELAALGVLLKDPTQGIVDFPALLDGNSVYLCWKFDESRVAHWHGVDQGFAGRQPLFPVPSSV